MTTLAVVAMLVAFRAGIISRTFLAAMAIFYLAFAALLIFPQLPLPPPSHGGGAPGRGRRGKVPQPISENFRSETCRRLDWGFPPPALRATSPV